MKRPASIPEFLRERLETIWDPIAPGPEELGPCWLDITSAAPLVIRMAEDLGVDARAARRFAAAAELACDLWFQCSQEQRKDLQETAINLVLGLLDVAGEVEGRLRARSRHASREALRWVDYRHAAELVSAHPDAVRAQTRRKKMPLASRHDGRRLLVDMQAVAAWASKKSPANAAKCGRERLRRPQVLDTTAPPRS